MAINNSDGIYLRVFIESLKDDLLSIASFNNIELQSQIDNGIPNLTLSVKVIDNKLLTLLTKKFIPIKIELGESLTNFKTYKFLISNYKFSKKDGLLFIYAILDLQEFITKTSIEGSKSTSVKVFESFKTISTKVLGVKVSDDEQVWIRYNITEKDHLYNILLHSYISDDNFLLSGINYNGDLIINDLKTISTTSNKSTFSDNPQHKKEWYSAVFDYETTDSINSFLFSKRDISTINFVDNKTEGLQLGIDDTTNLTQEGSLGTFINNGNCHKHYFSSVINNLSIRNKLYNKSIVFISDKLFSNNVELLELVKIEVTNTYDATLTDLINSGYYMITHKDIHISEDETYIRYKAVKLKD